MAPIKGLGIGLQTSQGPQRNRWHVDGEDHSHVILFCDINSLWILYRFVVFRRWFLGSFTLVFVVFVFRLALGHEMKKLFTILEQWHFDKRQFYVHRDHKLNRYTTARTASWEGWVYLSKVFYKSLDVVSWGFSGVIDVVVVASDTGGLVQRLTKRYDIDKRYLMKDDI